MKPPATCVRAGLVMAAALAAASHRLDAAEITVRDTGQLSAALAQGRAGDTIIFANGTWLDAAINLTRGGSRTAPLRLRAETPGRVILTGTSTLTFSAPDVEVAGLCFRNGAPKKGNVVQFNSDRGRLTNSAIIGYNPPATETGYYWVYFDGNYNRVDHCRFEGKNHHQPLVGNDGTNSRYNTVDYCHFKDIAHVPKNGREIFRIWGYGGNEELGPDGAFFTIANNLFEQAHGEGMEIISLKSNRNVVRNNTIRGSRGGITNRSGNYNTIEGNFVLGEGLPGAYGVRITGRHHTIVHNVIEGCTYGINLMCGEDFLRAYTEKFQPILRDGTVHGRVPAYHQPRHTTIAYNTLANNSGPDLLIGGDYKSGWPARQRVLLPELCVLAHNLISKPAGGVAVSIIPAERVAPLDQLVFAPNTCEGNLVSGGTINGEPSPAGFTLVPALPFTRELNGLLRPADTQLAQSSAAAAPAVFSKEPSPFQPLSAADVGPEWFKSGR